MSAAWRAFKPEMECEPFIISALVNDESFAESLIDSGCLSYGLCSDRYAQKHNLTRVKIKPREVVRFEGGKPSVIDEVAVVTLDLDGHRQERVFLYIAKVAYYDIILGLP